MAGNTGEVRQRAGRKSVKRGDLIRDGDGDFGIVLSVADEGDLTVVYGYTIQYGPMLSQHTFPAGTSEADKVKVICEER